MFKVPLYCKADCGHGVFQWGGQFTPVLLPDSVHDGLVAEKLELEMALDMLSVRYVFWPLHRRFSDFDRWAWYRSQHDARSASVDRCRRRLYGRSWNSIGREEHQVPRSGLTRCWR